MDLDMFLDDAPGSLVVIAGSDPVRGERHHKAFAPGPLPDQVPSFAPSTFLAVAEQWAALDRKLTPSPSMSLDRPVGVALRQTQAISPELPG
ncbi:hypothetical protein FOE78_18950 [Microlunatus elymi]|uniref:Uncharacterized protein n=1 Tax=Microlunatus elymi TaxID=2596828 RepID=A0A516Q3C8_9ACTN|nr:hypothetical protein [Microlunatus elymi]QDP97711.1 hypothetical protein FOE78_18950 [Microlunatus elymi]